MTKYYDIVGATRSDGSGYPTNEKQMTRPMVPDWSLKNLRKAFAKDGVTLHAKYVKTIPDHPMWRRDEATGKLVHVEDTEEVPLG